MNKFCSHCGREYDITANFCPSCGHKNEMAPAVQPVPVQPVQKQAIEVQPQAVQATPIQVQAAQTQATPVQVQVSQTQATPVQVQPQQTMQPQPAMYGSNQTYIDASMYANAPAKPKKNHTWIIVVSVVGGLFLLLIILCVVFISLMLKSGSTANDLLNNSSHRNLQELQDYYYADYKNADLDSSEFQDLNTESSTNTGVVSTESSSDATTESSSTVSVQSADFQDSDLTFINTANQEALNLSADTAYLLQASAPDRQASLSQSTVSQYTDNLQNDVHYSLGRGIAPGASLADFCNAYGINSSNSMLQVYNNDAWNYYYFSNPGTLSGLSADAICLTIGWSKKGDTWTRLNVNSLQNYFSSVQDASDDAVLFYTVTLDVPADSNTVSADSILLQTIQVEYGTPDAFYHFYGLNTSGN